MAVTVSERMAKMETRIDALWRWAFGNGQPGMEAKLMSAIGVVKGEFKQHVEQVERHSKQNMEDGDVLVLHEVQEERKARESQHAENRAEQKELGKKIDRLMYIQAGMSGALVMFKILEDTGIIHLGVGK